MNIAPLAFIKATEGNVIEYLSEGFEDGVISRGKSKGKARIRRAGPLAYTLMSNYSYRPDPGIIPPEEELKQAATGTMLNLITAGT